MNSKLSTLPEFTLCRGISNPILTGFYEPIIICKGLTFICIKLVMIRIERMEKTGESELPNKSLEFFASIKSLVGETDFKSTPSVRII